MNIDYKKIGFKCGLEIHQQLEGKKLFCNCQTLNTDKKGDYHSSRKLRAVVGETGEIDPAAAHEMAKGKNFEYTSHASDTCLIEYDEEPPRSVNKEALQTALTAALLLNAAVVDEIHFMRKTVVDGSNVSGFQRTGLIATNGFIETEEGKVDIPTICLEEEAAQRIKGDDKTVSFKLDRLGIPLIEIATSASILSAEHAKKIAARIGMVLRSVDGMKRGLGTIRQDVNVSIEKGARTEIKGFQDLKSIPKVVEYEINRQLEAITNGKKISKEVRKAEPDCTTSFLRPMPGAARMYPETDVLPIHIHEKEIAELKKNLPQLLGDKIKEFETKYDLTGDISKEVVLLKQFPEYVQTYNKIRPQLIASILITTPKEIKNRLKLDEKKLRNKDYEEVLGYLNDGKITQEAVITLLTKKIKGEKIDLSHFEGMSDDALEKEIAQLIKEKPGLNIGGYMGLVMAKYRGKVEGKKVMEMLKKYVS